MKIQARVDSSPGTHAVTVRTNDASKTLSIPPKPEGPGSSVNGGELLCLALATCYCNDLYREAKKRGLVLDRVEVEADATFGAEGAGAEQIAYRARVWSTAPREAILDLVRHTDTVAEIQNTLRRPNTVVLASVEANPAT